MNKPIFYQDATFRKIVVTSTGLGLSFLLGSLASLGISKGTGVQFGWNWGILAVVAIGVLWNFRFWNLVWARIERPDQKSIRRIAIHIIMLLFIAAGSFLYPLRFADAANWFSISKGLVTAVFFLSVTFYFIYKFGRIFTDMDKVELKNNDKQLPS